MQVANLALLGKVWGFLKYHHPAVTTGKKNWDLELFQITPKILAAPNRAVAEAALLNWVVGLGPLGTCSPCASLDVVGLQLGPEIRILKDSSIGSNLRTELERVYTQRGKLDGQFYVSLTALGNPIFNNESDYKEIIQPSFEHQLLALFRLWSVVLYWAPYRNEIDDDWDEVLSQFIPRVALAKDRSSYQLEMMAFIARIHDTHANLWSSISLRPPAGDCSLPVSFRFIDGRAVVTKQESVVGAGPNELQAGDIVEAFDGDKVDNLVSKWLPYYAASNRPTQMRDIAWGLGVGSCGVTKVRVLRGNMTREFDVVRIPLVNISRPTTHDRPGEAFQFISEDIAYLKLSSIKRTEIPSYLARASKSKGLIIDIRNYPSDFVPFALGQYFVDKRTDFVQFTVGDINNPGAFHWGPRLYVEPFEPAYTGKVMILLDETSQSQAEYTAMALRVGRQAKVVGSTTAGADGNVSTIPLPGGLTTMISGIGVFYPDKRPTQRIGIVPDIEVVPTIAGIREGRDEVLDAAIAEIRKD